MNMVIMYVDTATIVSKIHCKAVGLPNVKDVKKCIHILKKDGQIKS